MISSKEMKQMTETTLKIMLDHIRESIEKSLNGNILFIDFGEIKFKVENQMWLLNLSKKKPVLTNLTKAKEYPTDNLTKQNIENTQFKFRQYHAINHTIALVKKANDSVFFDAADAYDEKEPKQQNLNI